jgi:hypothetical protein
MYIQFIMAFLERYWYLYDPKTKTEVVPKMYPCEYFNRYSIDRVLIEYLINSIKDDDIYN